MWKKIYASYKCKRATKSIINIASSYVVYIPKNKDICLKCNCIFTRRISRTELVKSKLSLIEFKRNENCIQPSRKTKVSGACARLLSRNEIFLDPIPTPTNN